MDTDDIIDGYIVQVADVLGNGATDKGIIDQFVKCTLLSQDQIYLVLMAGKELFKARQSAPPKKSLIKRRDL